MSNNQLSEDEIKEQIEELLLEIETAEQSISTYRAQIDRLKKLLNKDDQ